MKHEIASEILNSDNWSAHACVDCGARFRDSIASRPGRVDGEVDLLCRDCAYQYDTRELKLTGVMSGTSLATAAYLRRDLDTFRMFFEAEVSLTPTLQAAWARYKDHPAIPRLASRDQLADPFAARLPHVIAGFAKVLAMQARRPFSCIDVRMMALRTGELEPLRLHDSQHAAKLNRDH